MNTPHHIADAELPIDRNFHQLKELGIDYIKELCGATWTNFNDSDPGVTILDQLCYALIELGYCIDFPIEDLLTAKTGDIEFDNRFFLPDRILTSSPVTLDDYKKLLIDGLDGVRAVYIEQTDATTPSCFTALIYIVDRSSDQAAVIREQAINLLNQNRSIAEYFTVTLLTPQKIILEGTIQLAPEAPQDVYSRIEQQLDDYIVAPYKQFGYTELEKRGFTADDIFDGPRLKNGWGSPDNLPAGKVNTLRLADLAMVIGTIGGVASIMNLNFGSGATEITIAPTAVAQIVLSPTNFALIGDQDGSTASQKTDQFIRKIQRRSISLGAATDLTPEPPRGKYREVEDYYSVQNTFPGNYGIGHNSLGENASAFRVAQSRQLKGYLMVFDQLLANEFSQLAHLGRLFSFDLTEAGDDEFVSRQRSLCTRSFVPTYAYQPLYDIPDVKLLLIGHDTYDYQFTSTNPKEQEAKAWNKFRDDPDNRYITGLRQCMEQTDESDDRRNRILNHLLARHGEDSQFFDRIVSDCRWCGSLLKTRIIVKSLWLQNFELLSYNRNKAYSSFDAQRLRTSGRYFLSAADADAVQRKLDFEVTGFLRPLIEHAYSGAGACRAAVMNALQRLKPSQIESFDEALHITDIRDVRQNSLMTDGQLDLAALQSNMTLLTGDFDNYSAFELKLDLLLGLTLHCQMLEDVLQRLLNSPGFAKWVAGDADKPFAAPGDDITVQRQDGIDRLWVGETCLLELQVDRPVTEQLYLDHLMQIHWFSASRKGFIFLEPALLQGDESKQRQTIDPSLFSHTLSIFPDYVSRFNSPAFKQKYDLILHRHFAANVDNHLLRLSCDELVRMIPHYVGWHNSLLGRLGGTAAIVSHDQMADWRLASLALARDETVWCVGVDGNVGIYDPAQQSMTDLGELGGWTLKSLAFADDDVIWCVSTQGNVGSYSISAKKMTTLGNLGGWLLQSCTFVSDDAVVCIGKQGNPGLYNLKTRTMKTLGALDGCSLKFASLGPHQTLWCVDADGRLFTFDIQSHLEIDAAPVVNADEIIPVHIRNTWPVVFCTAGADGTLWCVGPAGNVGVYDANEQSIRDRGKLGNWTLTALAFAPDGTLWCVSAEHTIGSYNHETNTMTDHGFPGDWTISMCAVASDGALWSLGAEGNIGRYSTVNDEMTDLGTPGSLPLKSFAFISSDTLLCVRQDNSVMLYSIHDGNIIDVPGFANWGLAASAKSVDGTVWCVGAEGNLGICPPYPIRKMTPASADFDNWPLRSCAAAPVGAVWGVGVNGDVRIQDISATFIANTVKNLLPDQTQEVSS